MTDMPTNIEIDNFISRLKSSGRVMSSKRRLRMLKDICLKYKDSSDAFVECGVAMGGCLALMRYLSNNKKIWGFDSFDGMPQQTEEDQGSGSRYVGINLSGKEKEQSVPNTFKILNVELDNVIIVKGWFEDTLLKHRESIGKISLLKIDCDWYKPIKFCLETLYESLVIGGTVVIDDYNTWAGCKQAVDEFRSKYNITSKIYFFPGGSEMCWVK